MSIPFTQYLLPDGRRRPEVIDMPEEIEALAERFIKSGGRYECEMLRDMETISVTAVHLVDDEPQDVVIKLCKNGPDVVPAVEHVVRESVKWLEDKP